MDLSASLGSLRSSASESDGSPEAEPPKALETISIEAATLVVKKDWEAFSDFDKITIRHGDSLPGMTSFTDFMKQSLSPLGKGVVLSKIQIVMMNEIMDGKLKAGHLYDLPMICTGVACIMTNSCPFTEVQAPYPMHQSCPVEKAQIARWVTEYLEEINSDTIHPSDRSMIRELVAIHIAQSRISASLAKDPDPMMEVSIGFDKDGTEVKQKRENPLHKERIGLAKQMERLMKNLHLTREQHKKKTENLDSVSALYDKLTRKADEICERFSLDMSSEDIHGGKTSKILEADIVHEDGQIEKGHSFFDTIHKAKKDDEVREEEKLAEKGGTERIN